MASINEVNHFENDEMDPYWDPQGEIPWRYYDVQPVPVQYQQFQYNPAVQQSWAEGTQLQHGQATFMPPYWTTTAEQQQYAAQQQFAAMHAQQCATQHQQVATQQQQAAAKQQNVATKHQQGAKEHQDEEKQQKEKTDTTKTIQERLEEMKETLEKEREEFSLKLKQQSRRVSDLEIKDKRQQDEIKEQTRAREIAENMWNKMEGEKNALDAIQQLWEKEGGKINRVLLRTERDLSKAEERILHLEADNAAQKSKLERFRDELSQEFFALRATYNELQERLRVQELTASKTIHGLKDEVAYYKSSYQKATEDLGVADQEQRSLAQRCELWKKSSQRKDLVCERLEKDKAVLSKKIQSEKEAKFQLQENYDNLRDDLVAFKKQVELLKEQNYNLRYYGGVIGKFRRMKRFIVNAFRRSSS